MCFSGIHCEKNVFFVKNTHFGMNLQELGSAQSESC